MLGLQCIWISGVGSEAGRSGASAALATGDGRASGEPDGEDGPTPATQSISTSWMARETVDQTVLVPKTVFQYKALEVTVAL